MGELANCPSCGTLFVKGVRDVCNNCYLDEERAFEKVHGYIRKKENRMATVAEVAIATEVSQKLIMKFVKQRRLLTVDFPNLSYGCERCGNPIQEGKICGNCRDELYHDLKLDQNKQERERLEGERNRTYYAVDKKIKKD